MQIAIVDDRAEDREELSTCLENYMKKHRILFLPLISYCKSTEDNDILCQSV